jgi:hypothetical protein
MCTAVDAVDAAIQEVKKARALVSKVRSKQVRGVDDLAALRSTAYAWFKTHRPLVQSHPSTVSLTGVDAPYQTILDSTDRFVVKKTYLTALKQAKTALAPIRAALLTLPPAPVSPDTDDLAPDFSPLAGSDEMREVLTRRWHECCKCVNAEAHLAAIVMMGGLLEALFVARANKLDDKALLVKATSAPKDKQTGKMLNYQNWMLDSYIKVGHELKWITGSAKQVADVLKEYRNYVHPEKELRHRVELAQHDSTIFWQVTKELARQLLMSAPSA